MGGQGGAVPPAGRGQERRDSHVGPPPDRRPEHPGDQGEEAGRGPEVPEERQEQEAGAARGRDPAGEAHQVLRLQRPAGRAAGDAAEGGVHALGGGAGLRGRQGGAGAQSLRGEELHVPDQTPDPHGGELPLPVQGAGPTPGGKRRS